LGLARENRATQENPMSIAQPLAPVETIERRPQVGDLVSTVYGNVWEVEEVVSRGEMHSTTNTYYVVDLTGRYPNSFRLDEISTLSTASAKANREAAKLTHTHTPTQES
jgi:hypothetical protein